MQKFEQAPWLRRSKKMRSHQKGYIIVRGMSIPGRWTWKHKYWMLWRSRWSRLSTVYLHLVFQKNTVWHNGCPELSAGTGCVPLLFIRYLCSSYRERHLLLRPITTSLPQSYVKVLVWCKHLRYWHEVIAAGNGADGWATAWQNKPGTAQWSCRYLATIDSYQKHHAQFFSHEERVSPTHGRHNQTLQALFSMDVLWMMEDAYTLSLSTLNQIWLIFEGADG